MVPHNPLLLILLPLIALPALTSAASPTSFCKCTCFTNSTIIPLDAPITTLPKTPSTFHLHLPRENEPAEDPLPEDPPSSPSAPESPSPPTSPSAPAAPTAPGKGKGKEDEADDRKEYRAGNCNDCNRQFCLDYNLPICKHAGMEDVFTTCFQRDSRKDEAVVFIFIFATAGLLIWAAVKPWVGGWMERARERRSYLPVSSGGDS
ncbi:hypothetical protein MMC28_000594 [Mycoblastus sanguinarius]|nr:hypothetical protein [Mycoblastus sanguinarius]